MLTVANAQKVINHGWKSRTIRIQAYLTALLTSLMTAYTMTPDSFRQLFDFIDETVWIKITAIIAILGKGVFGALLRADTKKALEDK